MPLSAAAAARFGVGAGEGCHIGIALPIDPTIASLGFWLVEAGFKVSFLAENAEPNASNLLARLSELGVAIFDTSDAFSNAACDIVLDMKGEHLCEGLRGATLAFQSLSTSTADLCVPMVHIGASPLVELCVSTHGVGQACVSGFLDITNLQIAGSDVLVIGYGAVGEGVAKYARSYGARVIVCENEPAKSVQARLDGYKTSDLDAGLSRSAVVFHTLESGPGLSLAQIKALPNGAFLCSAVQNSEAFPLAQLEAKAPGKLIREHVTQHEVSSSANVKLVCNGKPVHERAGLGLPLEYADVRVAAQLHAIAELTAPDRDLQPGLNSLPAFIETALAQAFLDNI